MWARSYSFLRLDPWLSDSSLHRNHLGADSIQMPCPGCSGGVPSVSLLFPAKPLLPKDSDINLQGGLLLLNLHVSLTCARTQNHSNAKKPVLVFSKWI